MLHQFVATVADGIVQEFYHLSLGQRTIDTLLGRQLNVFQIGCCQFASLFVEALIEHIGTSQVTFGGTLGGMAVATGRCTMLHQVGCTDEVGQYVREDDGLCILLWAGVGSGGSPVGGDVAPELDAPEVEQTTHEVGLA